MVEESGRGESGSKLLTLEWEEDWGLGGWRRCSGAWLGLCEGLLGPGRALGFCWGDW